jgi:hypothetical protein
MDEEVLTDLADDNGFEHLAVGPLDEHLIVVEADWDRGAQAKLAGNVAIGGFGIVLADILGAAHVDDDSLKASGIGGFAPDFLFGLRPVFRITAENSAVADVDFLGALTDGLLLVSRRRRSGVGSFCGGFPELISPITCVTIGSYAGFQ